MDIGLYSYKRPRGVIKHKTAAPFVYARPPAAAAPTPAPTPQAGGGGVAKVKPAAAPWAPPPSAVAVEVIANGGGAATVADDVDSRAALFISRVQERLRRERVNEDWRKYY